MRRVHRALLARVHVHVLCVQREDERMRIRGRGKKEGGGGRWREREREREREGLLTNLWMYIQVLHSLFFDGGVHLAPFVTC